MVRYIAVRSVHQSALCGCSLKAVPGQTPREVLSPGSEARRLQVCSRDPDLTVTEREKRGPAAVRPQRTPRSRRGSVEMDWCQALL